MYLIVGASSFAGEYIARYCQDNNLRFVGTYYSHPNEYTELQFNLLTDAFSDLLKQIPLDNGQLHILLCSAETNIDNCKRNLQESYDLNVGATKRLIDEVKTTGHKLVFFSSEAVFDGKTGLYTEKDVPHPITEYGRQKLEIEKYIQSTLSDALIFRLSRAVASTFGAPDIFGEFYRRMHNQEPIICLKGQSFCLTDVKDIAEAIVLSCERNLRGLYHISSSNYITRYELAQLYAQRFFSGYEKIYEKDYSEIPFLDNRHIRGGLSGTYLQGILHKSYLNLDDIIEHYAQSFPTYDTINS